MCGIGGRTIEEAKQAMSYKEYLSWCRYRSKRGSLNVGMRVEHGSALLGALYANSKSKHGGLTVYDFAPHHERPEITLDQAMKEWA